MRDRIIHLVKKKLIFVIPAALLAFSMVWIGHTIFFPQQVADLTGKETVTITLNKDGFTPQDVYVSRGTRVIFKTTLEKPFWPASDLHPFHTIYSAFDPKKPIEPTDSWSFIFDKDGHWNFHDHISLAVGSIIVVPPGEKGSPVFDVFMACDQPEYSGRSACYKERIVYALEKKGLEAAFKELASTYATYPEFRNSCHGFSHDLGLLAFSRFGKNIDIPSETLYCGQGFYHGYMEGFLARDGNTNDAILFCKKVAKALGDGHPIAGPQCVHGIGHGLMEYLLSTRPDLGRDLARLIHMGLEECSRAENYDERFRCASGIFAVFKDWINIQNIQKEYTDIVSAQDPFTLCKTLEQDWEKASCAWEMAKQILIISRNNVEKTFATEIRTAGAWEGGIYLPSIIMSSAFLIGEQRVEDSDESLASVCVSLSDESLRTSCIQGLELGLIFNAAPGSEIERPLRFCAWEGHREEERTACAATLITSLLDIRGAEGRKAACDAVMSHGMELPACKSGGEL